MHKFSQIGNKNNGYQKTASIVLNWIINWSWNSKGSEINWRKLLPEVKYGKKLVCPCGEEYVLTTSPNSGINRARHGPLMNTY